MGVEEIQAQRAGEEGEVSETRHAIVFDIDGTLADCEHRRHHVTGENKNWDAFFSGTDDDKIIKQVAYMFGLIDGNYSRILFTGRPEKMRSATEAWLARNGIKHHGLFMRKDGDFREDSLVKSEMVEALGVPIFAVFDDRRQTTDMFRRLGLFVFQVAEGNF